MTPYATAVAYGVTRGYCRPIKSAIDLPQTPLDCYSVVIVKEFAGAEHRAVKVVAASAASAAKRTRANV